MGEDYFQEMVRVLEHDAVKIKREVLLQRIRGSSDSPFNENDLNDINDNRKAPVEEIVLSKMFVMYVYEKIDPTVPYLIGVDPATGTGIKSDNTSIMVVDPFTLHSVANLVTPYTDPVETAGLIVELVKNHIPMGLVIIERNSLGSGVIAILGRTEISNRLYYNREKIIQETGEDKMDKSGYVNSEPELRRYWGLYTAEKNRAVMTKELLTYAVEQHKDRFVSRELIDDLNNLIQKPSGRIEARSGYHDDVVMSYLLALYVYEFDKYLYQWGIIKGMKKEKFVEKKKGPENTYKNVYNALTEEERSLFSDPNNRTSINMIDNPDIVDKLLDGSEKNEIYERWQRNRSNSSHTVIQEDGTQVKVSPNKSAKELVREAEASRTGGFGISQSIFDICDIINK